MHANIMTTSGCNYRRKTTEVGRSFAPDQPAKPAAWQFCHGRFSCIVHLSYPCKWMSNLGIISHYGLGLAVAAHLRAKAAEPVV